MTPFAEVTMSERLVVVRTFVNDLEAAMAKAELEASGIPVAISGGSLLPMFRFRSEIRLAVPAWAAGDAIALLQPMDGEEQPRPRAVDDEARPRSRPADHEERPRTRPAGGEERPRTRPPR